MIRALAFVVLSLLLVRFAESQQPEPDLSRAGNEQVADDNPEQEAETATTEEMLADIEAFRTQLAEQADAMQEGSQESTADVWVEFGNESFPSRLVIS